MRILIVGNIFKDVYLNLDERAEQFETDSSGTRWLNLSFDTSEHRFFRRMSSFGGSAITLEVLSKMGIDAEISGSKAHFLNGEIDFSGNEWLADLYRYILILDEHAAYIAPSYEHVSTFDVPSETYDYIFIDRSASINNAEALFDYLDFSPTTKLAVYVRKNSRSLAEKELIKRADLVFTERPLENIDESKLVFIEEARVSCGGFSEEFDTSRESLMTHLSVYSILSATILGGLLLGKSTKESLRLGKMNVEHATLDSCLDLASLEEFAASSN